MRPDNPSLRPCALRGFGSVGEGWYPILRELDKKFVEIAGAWDHAKIKVLQIKEKFGSLRVYINHEGFDEWTAKALLRVTMEAEARSLKTCEACGSRDGVDTRARRTSSSHVGRTLTLCAECHQKRDRDGILNFGGHTA